MSNTLAETNVIIHKYEKEKQIIPIPLYSIYPIY